jgi:hypothetical protein
LQLEEPEQEPLPDEVQQQELAYVQAVLAVVELRQEEE